MRTNHLSALALAAVAAVTACSASSSPSETPPTLLGLSASEIQVGHHLDFVGEDFLDPQQGQTLVRFVGTFKGDIGEYPVDYEVTTVRMNGSEVRWAYVGRFQVPFAPDGNELGTFEGTVTPINSYRDGRTVAGEPLPANLTFKPSIITYDFAPTGVQCDKPSRRAFGQVPYEATIATLGFQGDVLSVRVAGEPDANGVTREYKAAMSGSIGGGSMAFIGLDGGFTFAAVPPELTFYVADVTITVRRSDNGEAIAVNYPIPVYRPIAMVPYGEPTIAEIEVAQPVSGCISGGINGLHVRYEETKTDSRTRQVSYTWDKNWSEHKDKNVTKTNDWRNGWNTSWNQGGDTRWDMNWGWNGTVSGGFSAGVPLANVHAEVAYGKSGGGNDGGSKQWGNSGGNDESKTYTDSVGTTIGTTKGGSEGVSEFYDVSSSKTTTVASEQDIIPTMYGIWFRQATRWRHPAKVIEFDMCGEAHFVADVDIADYQWAVSLEQGKDCPERPQYLPEPVCYSGCEN